VNAIGEDAYTRMRVDALGSLAGSLMAAGAAGLLNAAASR